jgi:hypothetical protein
MFKLFYFGVILDYPDFQNLARQADLYGTELSSPIS